MSEFTIWALMLVFLASAAASIARALEIALPRLTARERWAIVFWCWAALGALHIAWRVGAA